MSPYLSPALVLSIFVPFNNSLSHSTHQVTMAQVNFYLKDSKAKSETLINLCFQYEGNRFKFSTGEKVHPKYWNQPAQRVKKSLIGSVEINRVLETVDNAIKKIHRTAVADGTTISNDFFRTAIKKMLNKDQGNKKSFFDYLEEFIEISIATRKANTIKKFVSLRNHLMEFQSSYRFNISFDRIDFRFYEQFTAYLINDHHHLNNTVGKYMAGLKTFMNWATDRGYNTFTSFMKFKTPNEEADIIYLTEKELMKLYSLNLKKNTRLEQVRDRFCFGCFTGLRFSDITRLRKENVKGQEMHFITQKTRDNLIVPLNDFSTELLEKYNYSFPLISNQKMNQYLKELGELAGIGDMILMTKYRGSEEIQIRNPKFMFITSHTARRTFVTLSLEKGMRAETVMSITGHKDYKVFKRYIKITNKVKSVEMKQIWKKEVKLSAVV